jgi:hypothetical protein
VHFAAVQCTWYATVVAGNSSSGIRPQQGQPWWQQQQQGSVVGLQLDLLLQMISKLAWARLFSTQQHWRTFTV